ncbi:hypothetical protein [Nocardia testacea]|uniref:hypothetical protein n=1 Tax=Nocardia testacea TaxID=248551 RepID=UPI00340A3F86
MSYRVGVLEPGNDHGEGVVLVNVLRDYQSRNQRAGVEDDTVHQPIAVASGERVNIGAAADHFTPDHSDRLGQLTD